MNNYQNDYEQAWDTIDKLRAENEQLRDVLKLVEQYEQLLGFSEHYPEMMHLRELIQLTLRDEGKQ